MFIETHVFKNMRENLLSDDEFQQFQTYLLDNPSAGDTIMGTGGCRKIRWKRQGMGKSGGVRVIYYHRSISGRIYLLLLYAKNQQENLTQSQKSALKNIISQME